MYCKVWYVKVRYSYYMVWVPSRGALRSPSPCLALPSPPTSTTSIIIGFTLISSWRHLIWSLDKGTLGPDYQKLVHKQTNLRRDLNFHTVSIGSSNLGLSRDQTCALALGLPSPRTGLMQSAALMTGLIIVWICAVLCCMVFVWYNLV